MDKAKEDVFNSNARTIKSVGVYQILMDKTEYEKGRKNKKWYVQGTVGASGDIKIESIKASGTATQYAKWKEGDAITVEINEVDLSALEETP